MFDDDLLAAADALRRRDDAARELEALEGCLGNLPQRQRQVLDASPSS